MASTKQTPREKALDQLAEHQGTVAHWEAEQAAAQAELHSLQERAGDEVLADPSAATVLSAKMQELQNHLDIACRVVAAARPKVEAARAAVMLAEAGEWDSTAAGRRQALEEHEARTNELLQALRDHDGADYDVVTDDRSPHTHGARVARRSKTRTMRAEVEQAELTARVLREVAAGRDPLPELQARANFVDGKVLGLPIETYYGASAALEQTTRTDVAHATAD